MEITFLILSLLSQNPDGSFCDSGMFVGVFLNFFFLRPREVDAGSILLEDSMGKLGLKLGWAEGSGGRGKGIIKGQGK